MYRWLFPKFRKVDITEGDITYQYRLSIVLYLLHVLPRWLLIACISLSYLTYCNCMGKFACTNDVVFAWCTAFVFGSSSCIGYGIMKILSLSEEEVDKLFKAVAGDKYKI